MEKLITLKCPICGVAYDKRLTAYNYHKKRGRKQFFCSKKCRGESQRNSEVRKCLECGKEFECWKSSRRKFCGRPCYDKWQNNKEKRECSWCGKPFTTWNNGNQKYCCKRCALASTGETNIEQLMRKELERRQIPFKQYQQIETFYVDFILDNNIVVECDGVYWHTKPEVEERDLRKNELLKQEGYKLFRFTDKEILSDVKRCVDEVLE